MTDHVYKTVEVVGSSSAGITQAIENAISKASQSLRNIGWFEVQQVRGMVDNDKGRVGHYQVTLKIGFRLE
jgi:flavin-binding protein dodecin